MFLISAFSSNLSTNKIGHNIKYLESIDSTNSKQISRSGGVNGSYVDANIWCFCVKR